MRGWQTCSPQERNKRKAQNALFININSNRHTHCAGFLSCGRLYWPRFSSRSSFSPPIPHPPRLAGGSIAVSASNCPMTVARTASALNDELLMCMANRYAGDDATIVKGWWEIARGKGGMQANITVRLLRLRLHRRASMRESRRKASPGPTQSKERIRVSGGGRPLRVLLEDVAPAAARTNDRVKTPHSSAQNMRSCDPKHTRTRQPTSRHPKRCKTQHHRNTDGSSSQRQLDAASPPGRL